MKENENATMAPVKPSFKQLAEVLGCPVDRIRSVARKPIPHVEYDPKAINWDAIDSFIVNRLAKTGYESLEDVYEAALAVEVKTSSRAAGVKTEMLDIAGSETTPARKIDVAVGDKLTDKKAEGAIFEVTYVDPTIVVYHEVNDEGKMTLSHSIGNRNFNSRFKKVTDAE